MFLCVETISSVWIQREKRAYVDGADELCGRFGLMIGAVDV